MTARGAFREDLLYRLNVVEIELPPLRARGADEVLSLAEHFLQTFASRHGREAFRLSADARDALATHRWPGNVRELEHAIERAVVLCSTQSVTAADLRLRPPSSAATDAEVVALPHGLSLAEAERRYILSTLARADGNQSEAARSLGVGRNTLRRKLEPREPE
ncbi:MAG: helix-turn-helix domain-containing protein [Polyangiales bacterium]